jgi:hypothetical protein
MFQVITAGERRRQATEIKRPSMKPFQLMLATILVVVAGCAGSTRSENPEWVDQLREQFESAPVGNPPQSIWRYEYDGQVVY